MSYHIGIFSPPTTVTLIIDGGIIIATRHIWMGSMETQIMPKQSIGITGKVLITQWR